MARIVLFFQVSPVMAFSANVINELLVIPNHFYDIDANLQSVNFHQDFVLWRIAGKMDEGLTN